MHLIFRLLKLQKQIFLTNTALSYFQLNTWQFRNQKMMSVLHHLSADNKKDFGFDFALLDTQAFIK